MSWNALVLTLELQGNLHCGDLPLGFVARTFPYVPCHIPVFALVPAAVRQLGLPDRHDSYKKMEKLFLTSVRSTPLFIRQGSDVLFPWVPACLQEIEHKYIASHYGVALDNKNRSAEDSRLYETESILAVGRQCSSPTCMEGCLFVRRGECDGYTLAEDGTLSGNGRTVSLQQLCDVMQLGGDRSRALGKPAKASLQQLADGKVWGVYSVDTGGEWPSLCVSSLDVAPAGENRSSEGPLPLRCDADGTVKNSSGMLVLTGRRHTAQGAGLGMDEATIAYSMGWQCDRAVKARLVNVRFAEIA